jgi:hypothetical protein
MRMATLAPSLTVSFADGRQQFRETAALQAKMRDRWAVPYIAVDGVEHAGDWGTETRVDISPGGHRIVVYTRLKKVLTYRAAKGKAAFTVSDGDSVRVRATFGNYTTATEVSMPGHPRIRRRRFNWF